MNEETSAPTLTLADSTADKGAERRGETQPLLGDVLDALASFVALLSPEGRVLEVNRPALDISSVKREDVLGKPLVETYWYAHDEALQAQLSTAVARAAAGETSRYNSRVRLGEDRFLTIDLKLAPVFDRTGRVAYLVASGLDISERLRNEAALNRQEERLQLALEAGAMGTFDWDLLNGDLVFSDTQYALAGVDPGTSPLTSETFFERVHPDDLPGLEAAIEAAKASNRVFDYEFRVCLPDGSARWLAGRGNFLRDARGKARRMSGVNYDVTERKQGEERLRYLAQASKLLTASLEVEVTLQQTAEVMVPFLADWCVVDVPDDADVLEQVALAHADPAKLKLAEEMRRRYPPDARTQGASKVVATGERALFPDISDELLKASAQDEEHLRLIRAVGMKSALIVPLRARGQTFGALTLVWAESGRRYSAADLAFAEELAGRAAVAVDNAKLYRASRLAEAEFKALNAQLEQRVEDRTAKLAAVNGELEAFNYSVSHDLRAPLRGVTGFSQALLEDYGGQFDETAQHYVARIQAAAQRMGDLIDDLLDLSRLARAEMKVSPLDLSALAREVVDDLRSHHQDRDVAVTLEPNLHVQGDPRLLKVVLENFFNNAWKFTGHEPNAAVAFGRTQAGAYFVRDNGAGFDMRYAGKLFSPFQRLHSPQEFEGSGIGLATVQRIVHRHGGMLWAESEVDVGATFYFTLPETSVAAEPEA